MNRGSYCKSRRRFISDSAKTLATLGFGAALPANAKSENSAVGDVHENGFSILQGLTTESVTQLTIDVPKQMKIKVSLVDTAQGTVHEPAVNDETKVDWSEWRVDFYQFENLKLGRLYLLQIRDEKEELLDERELSTVDLSRNDARIAVLSCMLDMHIGRFKLWSSLNHAQPDYMFFCGDNVYGDIGGISKGPRLLWRRYIETRQRVPVYRFRRLIPTLATWDDHDYGKNNSGGSYVHKDSSRAIFKTFFPQRDIKGVFENGVGISGCFNAFGTRFLFMDSRFFRDLELGGYRNFWGQEQSKWAYEKFKTNDPVWLVQGSQFFGAYNDKGQSFEQGYEEEFSDALSKIGKRPAPTLFLSGDVHYSEFMDVSHDQIGYRTHEITSSAIHSFTRFVGSKKNYRRCEAAFKQNFVLIKMLPATYTTVYEVACIGANERTHFSRHISY